MNKIYKILMICFFITIFTTHAYCEPYPINGKAVTPVVSGLPMDFIHTMRSKDSVGFYKENDVKKEVAIADDKELDQIINKRKFVIKRAKEWLQEVDDGETTYTVTASQRAAINEFIALYEQRVADAEAEKAQREADAKAGVVREPYKEETPKEPEQEKSSQTETTPEEKSEKTPQAENPVTEDAQKTNDAETPPVKEEVSAEKDEQTSSNEQYTGVYKERQLIPNIMAIHCKMNAEDVVKDMSLLDQCMRQYLAEINSEEASAREIGFQDYDVLRRTSANDLASTAITKSAAIQGFEDKFNEYASATNESDTKFNMENALNNTQAFSTDVINSLRELYIEVIENTAIIDYQSLNAAAILDANDFKNAEANKTEVKTAEGGEKQEIVATGNKNAKQYLDKFRAMDDKKLAQQKAQYQSILSNKSSNEDMKKEAQNGLRYVEHVESERKK